MKKALGIDIGGTKIAVGLIDENGSVLVENKVTSNISTKETMFASLTEAIDQLIKKIDVPLSQLSFGIGVPGLVDREQGIAVFQNNLPWENFPIVARLKEKYPEILGVTIDNDVYQAAYAEWKAAKLSAGDTLTFITASTGISSASLTNGAFIRGQGFAGEIGLLPRPKNGENLTLEDSVGGNNLAKRAAEKLNRPGITTKEIFAGYFAQQPAETAIVKEWIADFAYGIYAMITVLDPMVIVLGGSIIKLNPDLLPTIKEEIKKLMIPAQYRSLEQIKISNYDNNAGLIGAGLSGLDKF